MEFCFTISLTDSSGCCNSIALGFFPLSLNTHVKKVFTQYYSLPSCTYIFCVLQHQFPGPEDEVFEKDLDTKGE